MRNTIFTISALFFCYLFVNDQDINPPENMGGGEYIVEKTECLSNQQRAEIKAMLKANVARLIKEGKLKPVNQLTAVHPKFKWPLKEATAYDYKYYYGISNLVDHDTAYPNHV